jgi:hypothetical protein
MHQSFTDIGQFREVIRQVKHDTDYKGKNEAGEPIFLHDKPYPTLKFRGTVKLHGTNSSIVKYKEKNEFHDEYEFQSRERILELGKDNNGFMLSMKGKSFDKLFGDSFNDHCAIYGEWCGGSIQKGIAINGLPKMFVIFAVKIDNIYQDMFFNQHLKIENQQIYNILQFEHYFIDIDFENPQMVQNGLVEMTQKVEEQCPVGKHFGKTGVGEGIVWEHISDGKRYIFKVKGEKHQSSHIKKLVTVDTEEINNIKEFVEYAVTESRLKQGIDKLIELGKPVDMKSTGDYLRWIFNDIIKEEEDTIVKNGIDVKKIGKEISNKAMIFWLNHLNSQVGLI